MIKEEQVMGGIFSMNSKLIKVLNNIVDVVFLNIVFIITCMPILTIGPAITALYSVTLKLAAKEDIYVIKAYFKALRENFKKSEKAWLVILAVIVLIGINFRICLAFDFAFKQVVMGLLCMMALLVAISFVFVFPIIAKFEVPLKNAFINSILMPLSKPLLFFTIMLIQAVPIITAMYSQAVFIIWIYLLVMGWFSLVAYVSSIYINKLFHVFIGK